MRSIAHLLIGAAGLATLTAPAHAAEYVVNGGFEDGDFTGWTETDPYQGDPGYVGVDGSAAHSGSFGAYFGTLFNASFGNPVDYDTLTQSVATVTGKSYTLSFWLASCTSFCGYDQEATDSATVTFGGQTLLALVGQAPSQYQKYSYTVTGGAGNATDLSFSFSNIPSYWSLDDVSLVDAAVTPGVPEPTSWALLIAGFAASGVTLRRRRARVALRPA